MITEEQIRLVVSAAFEKTKGEPIVKQVLLIQVLSCTDTTPRQFEEHSQEFNQYVSDHLSESFYRSPMGNKIKTLAPIN